MLRTDSKWSRQGITWEWWKGDPERNIPGLPRAEREAFLATLTDDEVEDFFHDWRVWARDKQLAPNWDWDTWLLLTGRGFGKTRTAVETIRDWVETSEVPLRIAIVGQGEDDVRNVMVEGESGFIPSAPSWNRPRFYPSAGGGRLVWPNGSQAFMYSIADTEALRGPQFHYGWVDEIMASPRVQRERALDNLEFCLRLGHHPRLLLTTTPKKDPWLREMEMLAKDPANKIAITRGSLHENAANLPDNYRKKIVRKYGGTRLGKQEIDGVILADEEGALWTEDGIAKSRNEALDPIEVAEDCDKVVVSVDPNTKSQNPSAAAQRKKIAHAAGIVVVGRLDRRHFTIADRSTRGGPSAWAMAAVRAAMEFEADEIHAENNQGGDMVKIVLQQAMDTLKVNFPIHLGFAKASKAGRAEPVATLYDRGDVCHVGPASALENLETQMIYLHEGEDPTGEDFDRVDALVWGHTRLGLKKRASSSGSSAGVGFRTFNEVVNGQAQQRASSSGPQTGGDAEF